MIALSRETRIFYGYEVASFSSEGVTPVFKDKKWFFVNSDGIPIFDERYDKVGAFSNGKAPVFKDGRWSYIEKPTE